MFLADTGTGLVSLLAVVPALVLEGKTSFEPLGALVLQVGVGDPGGEQVEGSLGAHQG